MIGPCPGTTPSDLPTSRSQFRTLPYDVLKEASHRLGIMSLVASGLWAFGTLFYHVAVRSLPEHQNISTHVTDAIALISVLLSLALFFYTRRKDLNPKFVLNLGLVYMVLTALAIGLVTHWHQPPGGRTADPMITWIGAVVLMSAAIVPNDPLKTLVAGLIAASMNPISMLIARVRGVWDFGPVSNVLVKYYPDYMLVVVSVVISLVVTKLGHSVAQAREMGSYRLISKLGKGGMGEVWRARHRMLARDAAIKLIQPEMLSRSTAQSAEMIRRRFEQEAKTTATLRSPHTVALYDYGVTEDGVFYYVMELLDGVDLETLVKRFGPLSPARVVHIMKQMCRSLADAHQRGMIHRDIKPTNVVLCRMGNEYDFTKVLDFGLVKVMDRQEVGMTVVGAMMGTPAHIAPELALGDPNIDGRTDLYGLGCVAYWLVAGRPVFEEKGTTAMTLAHLNKVPVRPSEKLGHDVPAALERVIMMCLSKEPSERPANADSLLRMLNNLDDIGDWTADDAEAWWRMNIPEGVAIEDGAPMLDPSPSAYSTV